MVRAVDGEGVIRHIVHALGHKAWCQNARGPASGGVVFHAGDSVAFSKGHPQFLDAGGPDAVELGVVFAEEHQFDRLAAKRLGRQRRRYGVVAVQTTAKTTAQHVAAHHDLIGRGFQRFGQDGQDQRLPLVARVDFPHAFVVLEHGRVHRLQLKVQDGLGGILRL